MHFVYVKVPASAAGRTANHEHNFHAALQAALSGQNLGAVIGWGASLPGRGKTGLSQVAFHRIDIEVLDLAVAIEALRRTLIELGAAVGTELHYSLDGVPWQQALLASGWGVAAPLAGGNPPDRPGNTGAV